MSEVDTMPTTVIFRRYRNGGDLIALFPTIEADCNPANCQSYQRVGQHGAAHYNDTIKTTRPAFRGEDLKSLKLELAGIGYVLSERLASPASDDEWLQTRRNQLTSYFTPLELQPA